ncbi:hypothetical protein PCANC_19502 [Puccinia coronata f. sp. avenae]|uniref:Uncharacterized protein n=1 Tax=Puccinia coronata f. sp. avenae TaxID=200324 RepID=A0A2N5SFS5_9BASI|nr:hypothetical protein PCANC_19502 [Puccinia coronata f. sp. avenae]
MTWTLVGWEPAEAPSRPRAPPRGDHQAQVCIYLQAVLCTYDQDLSRNQRINEEVQSVVHLKIWRKVIQAVLSGVPPNKLPLSIPTRRAGM